VDYGSGDWVNDRTHGQQFKARFLRTSTLTSIEGIEKYLASGMIRGIGPVYAKKLLRAFGEKVFDVIETEPGRLREVDGIGPVRASRIAVAWAEQKVVREIMVFLHSKGVGTARAVRIYKTYGADAIQVMSENPYRLARDIRGIGFKTADAIAMKLGIDKSAMIRVRAGISYALTEAMDEGHCDLPSAELTPGRGSPLRGASLGPADGSHFPATSAAAEKPIATVRLQPRHTHSRWHFECLQNLSGLRVDAPQITLLFFESGVPELPIDPGDSSDEAVGFDGA
jgi:Holliday junction resolvasome RuvABC DNA-binding subunit